MFYRGLEAPTAILYLKEAVRIFWLAACTHGQHLCMQARVCTRKEGGKIKFLFPICSVIPPSRLLP